MNDMVEMPSTGAIDALARNGQVQQVRTSYATAMSVQRPRQLADVQRRFLEESRLAGEDFYYGWGAGKDKIEGASVKLAMSLARCWGNCAIENLPVQDLHDSWIFTASFVDLETGFTLTRQFRQSKRWTVHGKFDQERKDDIRFQIGQSKAARNVVVNSLPQWLIDRAMEEAKAGVREKIETYVKSHGLVAAADLAIAAFAKYGVKEESILRRCLIADRKAITVDHLVSLRGDLSAIESGQERAETLYPPDGGAADQANKSRADQIVEKLKTLYPPGGAADQAQMQEQTKAAEAVTRPLPPSPALAEGEVPNEPAPAPSEYEMCQNDFRRLCAAATSRHMLQETAGALLKDNETWLTEIGKHAELLAEFQGRFKELAAATKQPAKRDPMF